MFRRIGKSYREFVDDWFAVRNAIVETLGLSREEVPHYTTLVKFGFRVFSILLGKIMHGRLLF
jgi:hypothetical protein